MELIQPEVGLVCAAAALATVAVLVAVRRVRRGRVGSNGQPGLANLDQALASDAFRRLHRRYRLLLGAEVCAVSIVAVAAAAMAMRPADRNEVEQHLRTRDVMLCLDVSGSMTEVDAEIVDRFADIAAELDGERIGLTVWDSSPVSLFPLTNDYEFISDELDEAGTTFTSDSGYIRGTYEGDGSSLIGDGLASCVMRFDRLDEPRTRAIILATDNYVSGSQIMTLPEAAAFAASEDIRVYAISPEDYTYDGDSDELAELREAAESTGGVLYELTDDASVDEVVAAINEREGAELDVPPTVTYDDRPRVFLAIAVGGAVAWFAVALVVRR